jgi:hypothetical protein
MLTIIKEVIVQTVLEMPEFITQSKKILSDDSRIELINYLALNPLAGDLISGTGGVRKLRWAGVQGRGKSGGVRVIYFYFDISVPIFLLTIYPKSKKTNLTMAECNILKSTMKELVHFYKGGKND